MIIALLLFFPSYFTNFDSTSLEYKTIVKETERMGIERVVANSINGWNNSFGYIDTDYRIYVPVKEGVSHLSRSFRHEVGHSFYNLYELDKNIIWTGAKKPYINDYAKKNDEEYFAEAFAFFHSKKYDGRFENDLEELFITLIKNHNKQ